MKHPMSPFLAEGEIKFQLEVLPKHVLMSQLAQGNPTPGLDITLGGLWTPGGLEISTNDDTTATVTMYFRARKAVIQEQRRPDAVVRSESAAGRQGDHSEHDS